MFPVIATPVSAVGEGGCESLTAINEFIGDRLNPSTFTNVRGIRSQIFDQQDLDTCTGTDGSNGPSYWVALVPAPGNPSYNDPDAILQIGVIRCHSPLYAVCTGSPRYFWADGGCDGGTAFKDLPMPQDLGPAPIGGITFAVRHVGNGTYWLTADPVTAGYPTISYYTQPDSWHIGCWAIGGGADRPVAGEVFCERLDRGDNCGGSGGSNPVDFTTIRFQVSVDGQWYIPGNAGSPLGPVTCSSYFSEGHCIDQGDDRFGTYVIQQ